jgi:hypothetical protein
MCRSSDDQATRRSPGRVACPLRKCLKIQGPVRESRQVWRDVQSRGGEAPRRPDCVCGVPKVPCALYEAPLASPRRVSFVGCACVEEESSPGSETLPMAASFTHDTREPSLQAAGMRAVAPGPRGRVGVGYEVLGRLHEPFVRSLR